MRITSLIIGVAGSVLALFLWLRKKRETPPLSIHTHIVVKAPLVVRVVASRDLSEKLRAELRTTWEERLGRPVKISLWSYPTHKEDRFLADLVENPPAAIVLVAAYDDCEDFTELFSKLAVMPELKGVHIRTLYDQTPIKQSSYPYLDDDRVKIDLIRRRETSAPPS